MPDAQEALRAAARFGPYFVWEPYDGGPGWRPLADLLDAGVVAERVEVARGTLTRMSGLTRDDIDERPVASIVFLGLASRLLSPMLAAHTATGVMPVPEKLWWRPVPGGPVPFAHGAVAGSAREPADALIHAVRTLVEPVLDVFRVRWSLSTHVLWGNVASALGGAVAMIGADSGATVAAALELDPLRGKATMDRQFLVRRNCCLYYRIPGGGTCGDCILNARNRRRS